MKDQLSRMEDKLDSHGNRLTAIEGDLKHHIARSNHLEKIVSQHERYFWFAMGAISLAGPIISQLLKLVFK